MVVGRCLLKQHSIEKALVVLVSLKAEWPSFEIGFMKYNGVKIPAEKCPFFVSFLWTSKEMKRKPYFQLFKPTFN